MTLLMHQQLDMDPRPGGSWRTLSAIGRKPGVRGVNSMSGETSNKGLGGANAEREERAASVNERLRAAKAEILSATPVSAPQQSSSVRPLLVGVGVIAVAVVLWMVFSGGKAPEELPSAAALPGPATLEPVTPEAEPSAALVEARERARQARERIRAAEAAAQEARERRLALEAEQAAQRAQEAEQARREAEALAAELAAAKEANQRQALEARQAQARREAEDRAARAERERQAALVAQQAMEAEASREADEARQGLGDQLNWGVDL